MKASRRQIATLRSLRKRKGRQETGLCLVEGRRLCTDLFAAGTPVEMLLVEEGMNPKAVPLIDRFARAGAPVLEAPSHEVQRVSDTVHSQGIVAAARMPDYSPEKLHLAERAVLVVLDRVSDPGNVGTIIRTAEWFGASAVLLGEGCADLLNPKTLRATMGAAFRLPVCREVCLPDAMDGLKAMGFTMAVAAADGLSEWRSWAEPARSALILGSEAHGVSAPLRERADAVLSIPRRGEGESLNVAVTAGVFLSCLAES